MKGRASLALLALLLCAGCEKGNPSVAGTPVPKMRVARIDTVRILAEMPHYKELQSAMIEDKSEYFASLQSKGDPRKLSKEQWDELRVQAQKKRVEWQKRIVELGQSSIKDISELTAEVAKQRNLDMVVIDTAGVVQYIDGQDVTTDVILKLKK